MKTLFFIFFALLFSSAAVIAAGEGTYGNETYGNFSYGISSSASASFSNDSVTTTANTATVINATQGTSPPNVELEMVTNANTDGAVTLVKYNSKPPTVSTNILASPLNKYLDMVVDNSISSQLNYSIIKMFYTDAEVSAANLEESTMRLSRWNGSEWVKFDAPTGGVDTVNNFVWANTSSFSIWGVFGTAVESAPSPSGGTTAAPTGGGGGGSIFSWRCTSWSECSPAGTQTRTCNLLPGSGGATTKPAETQSCTYTAPAPAPKTPSPATTAAASAASVPAVTPTSRVPTGAAVAPPTRFSELTGALISDLKNPSTWIGIVVAVLALAGLYAGYYYLYKKRR